MFDWNKLVSLGTVALAKVTAYIIANPKKGAGAAFAVGTLFGVVLF